MKLFDKAKEFYNEHKMGVKIVVTSVVSAAGGFLLNHGLTKMKEARAIQEAINDIPHPLCSDGSEPYWTDGYNEEEFRRSFIEEQEKARLDYPEKFEIMEEAISKMNLDLDNGEMWLIENGEPAMFLDSWYNKES